VAEGGGGGTTGLRSELAALQKLLTKGGAALVTMSFFSDKKFVATIARGTATRRVGTATLSQFAGVSIGGLSGDRVLADASVPLFVLLLVTVAAVSFFVLLRALVGGLWVVGAGAVRRFLCGCCIASLRRTNTMSRMRAGNMKAAASDRMVPFSRAAHGETAMRGGRELALVGRSFAIRAQEHVYRALGLEATLAGAGVDAAHLAFAEADGVFSDDAVRGLLFLTPAYWGSPAEAAATLTRLAERGTQPARGSFKLPAAGAGNYRARLAAWAKAASAVAPLDVRVADSRAWDAVRFSETWQAGPAAAALAAEAEVPAPVAQPPPSGTAV
jgi:hypothetical protein